MKKTLVTAASIVLAFAGVTLLYGYTHSTYRARYVSSSEQVSQLYGPNNEDYATNQVNEYGQCITVINTSNTNKDVFIPTASSSEFNLFLSSATNNGGYLKQNGVSIGACSTNVVHTGSCSQQIFHEPNPTGGTRYHADIQTANHACILKGYEGGKVISTVSFDSPSNNHTDFWNDGSVAGYGAGWINSVANANANPYGIGMNSLIRDLACYSGGSSCALVCGNGRVDVGEQCEPGANNTTQDFCGNDVNQCDPTYCVIPSHHSGPGYTTGPCN